MSSEPHKRLPLLLACMVIIWGASQLNSETSLQRQFYQPETRLEGGIVVNGGFLQAITPLTIYRYKVLGVGVDSEKHKEIIERILFCESSNRHEGVWGDLNYKHHAYGIAQFQRRTFYWMAGLSGMQGLNWKNKEDQIWLLNWALENNLGKHWTCYNKIK